MSRPSVIAGDDTVRGGSGGDTMEESHLPLDVGVSKRHVVARAHAIGVEGHAFGVNQTDL